MTQANLLKLLYVALLVLIPGTFYFFGMWWGVVSIIGILFIAGLIFVFQFWVLPSIDNRFKTH